jgi:hypothetical protein
VLREVEGLDCVFWMNCGCAVRYYPNLGLSATLLLLLCTVATVT